jgi:hypothetical protein
MPTNSSSIGTAQDVAKRWPDLFETKDRVYQLARQGVIPCIRLGSVVKFDLRKVAEWIDNGGSALPGGWRREPPKKTATRRSA